MDVNGGGDSAHKRKHIVWNEENLSYNEANKSVRGGGFSPSDHENVGLPFVYPIVRKKKKKTYYGSDHTKKKGAWGRERKGGQI